jgi:phosphatidylglycerophosphate synthase
VWMMPQSIEELKKICQNRTYKHDVYMWCVARKISIYITSLFIRTNITPNQITSFSILFGMLGSLFFLSANPWYWILGWGIINVHLILDQCDGEVAFYKKKVSKFGYFFDELSHPIVNTFFFAMIALSVYSMTNDILYLFFGITLVFSASIYRMVGLYEDYMSKSMFKMRTHKTEMPRSWVKRILSIPHGLGGYFHIFLLAALGDLVLTSFGIHAPLNMRAAVLIVMSVGFPLLLIRRVYNFKERLKDEKL